MYVSWILIACFVLISGEGIGRIMETDHPFCAAPRVVVILAYIACKEITSREVIGKCPSCRHDVRRLWKYRHLVMNGRFPIVRSLCSFFLTDPQSRRCLIKNY